MIDLQQFSGEGTASAASGTAPDAGEQTGETKILYGKQPSDEGEAGLPDAGEGQQPQRPLHKTTSDTLSEKNAAFEQLIRGDYKEQFDSRVQGIIDRRFKETQQLKSQVEGMKPLLALLAQKYGVDSADAGALTKAVEEDQSLWEEAASEQGLTVTQYREMQRLRQENAQLVQRAKEQEAQRQAQQQQAQWVRDAEALKQAFPDFDFQLELQNPQFTQLLLKGVPLEHAYKLIHMDELMTGAMQATANAVSAQVADNIRARALRPGENGVGSGSGLVVKEDVSKLTAKDRRDIARRAARGEIIRF